MKAFEFSPLDKFLAIVIIILTFFGYSLKLVRIGGDEYLEFLRWQQRFQEERHRILETPAADPHIRTPAGLSFERCMSPAKR